MPLIARLDWQPRPRPPRSTWTSPERVCGPLSSSPAPAPRRAKTASLPGSGRRRFERIGRIPTRVAEHDSLAIKVEIGAPQPDLFHRVSENVLTGLRAVQEEKPSPSCSGDLAPDGATFPRAAVQLVNPRVRDSADQLPLRPPALIEERADAVGLSRFEALPALARDLLDAIQAGDRLGLVARAAALLFLQDGRRVSGGTGEEEHKPSLQLTE